MKKWIFLTLISKANVTDFNITKNLRANDFRPNYQHTARIRVFIKNKTKNNCIFLT